MYFDYVVTNDRDNPLQSDYGMTTNVISDFSNVPYDNMEFKFINDVGKQWIKKYGLNVCKELLGMIRSKYGRYQYLSTETSLDGDTLRSENQQEKKLLLHNLGKC